MGRLGEKSLRATLSGVWRACARGSEGELRQLRSWEASRALSGRVRSCRSWSERGLGLSQCVQVDRCGSHFCLMDAVDSRRRGILTPGSLRGVGNVGVKALAVKSCYNLPRPRGGKLRGRNTSSATQGRVAFDSLGLCYFLDFYFFRVRGGPNFII